MRTESMFPLNPCIRAKTYNVFGSGDKPIGEVNASDVHEALRTAKQKFRSARVVVLKRDAPKT